METRLKRDRQQYQLLLFNDMEMSGPVFYNLAGKLVTTEMNISLDEYRRSVTDKKNLSQFSGKRNNGHCY